MARKTTIDPPATLKQSAAFWRSTVAAYELEPHHLELLRLACEALDRATSARQAIERDGEYFNTGTGFKAHGALKIEHDSRAQFSRFVREIGLDLAESETRPTQARGGGKGRSCRE